MHMTESKRTACDLHPWERKNSDRTCQHGDTKMLARMKRQASKARRQADKREVSL